MQLNVTHVTQYDYRPAVEVSAHLAHLRPVCGPCQEVVQHALKIEPEADESGERVDAYGNAVQFWALHSPHESLCVTATSHIVTREPQASTSTLGWAGLAALYEYQAGKACPPHAQYTFASTHVPISAALRDWALDGLMPETSALATGIRLTQRIHSEFVYDSQSTHVGTSMMDAFERKRGVCQDFAHILLSALRSLGLPARYVSGYLLTEPPPGQTKLIGSDASHAWVSIFLPDAENGATGGWYDLDPTNNRHGWGSPGTDYVHLASGRDYADISPLRGVLQGGGSHQVSVGVTVSQSLPA